MFYARFSRNLTGLTIYFLETGLTYPIRRCANFEGATVGMILRELILSNTTPLALSRLFPGIIVSNLRFL